MKRFSRALLLCLVVLFSVSLTGADTIQESYVIIDGQRVSMAEMIMLMLKNDFDLRSKRMDASMADSNYRKFMQKYAPYLSAETGFGQTNYPDNVSDYTGTTESKWDASVGIMKMFSTGTTVTAGVSETYTDLKRDGQTVNMVIDANPATTAVEQAAIPYPVVAEGTSNHRPAVFLKVEQELLKNGFGVNDRKSIELMKNGAEIQLEYMKLQISSVTALAVVEYWQLALAKKTHDNAKIKLAETRKVRNIVSENVRLGLSESFEQNYYNALVAGAEATEASTSQQLEASRRKIRTILNLDDSVQISENIMLVETLSGLDENALLESALAKRNDYIAAQLLVKNARYQISVFDNEELPSLTASATINSFGTDESFGSALGDSLTLGGAGYDLRAKMTYPLSNPQLATDIRDAKFKYEQSELARQKLEREIRDDVKNKIEYIKSSYITYQKMKAVRMQSGIYYNKMSENLRRGRFTAETVKAGLDAYVDSIQRELQALVGYNIALLQLDITTNQFFEKNGIDVAKFLAGE